MRNRNALLVAIIFFKFIGVSSCFSQDVSLKRQVIPQSPNVASLLKFDQHPVSISTGLPEINVPVYTIASQNTSLPISLRYHSGGVKVTDVASWVGMGWALDCGGVISQNIRGLADDYVANNGIGRLNSSNIDMDNPTICDLKLLAEGTRDAEPDIFNFSFNGKSGQFYIDDNNNIVQIPEQKLKIEVFPGKVPGNPFGIASWKITDLDGVQYLFSGDNEEVLIRSVSIRDQEVIGLDMQQNIPSKTQKSFYLSSIIDVNGDSINFSYDNYTIRDVLYSGDTKNIVGNSTEQAPCTLPPSFSSLSNNYQTQIISAKRIKSITFKNGRIDFLAGTERCDLYGDKFLDRIIVYNLKNEKIKEQKLNYKYFMGGTIYDINQLTYPASAPDILSYNSPNDNPYKNIRLFLNSVDEIDVGTNVISGKYSFNYINSVGLPDRFSAQQDWWGYFNGNSLASPLDGIFQDPAYGRNTYKYTTNYRNPSFSHSTEGVLNKITYPTGGTAEFEFEQNTKPGSTGPDLGKITHQPVTYNVGASTSDYFLGNLVLNDGNNKTQQMQFEVQSCIFGPNLLTIPRFVIKDAVGNVVYSDQQVAAAPYVNNPNSNSRTITLALNNGSYKIYSFSMGLPCNYFVRVLTWYEDPPMDWVSPVGGVRVKTSTLFDPITGKKLIKKYGYNEVENGIVKSTGRLTQGLFSVGYKYLQSICNLSGNITDIPSGEKVTEIFVLSSRPTYPLGNVIYDTITEQQIDGEGNDLGYSKYSYLNNSDQVHTAFLTKDYYGDVTTLNWGAPLFSIYDYSWFRNKLMKKEVFINDSGLYKKIKKEQYYYYPIYTDTISSMATGYHLRSGYSLGKVCNPGSLFLSSLDKINYATHPIYSGYLRLDSTVTEEIDKNNLVIKGTREFEYSNATLLPSKISEIGSGGKKHIQMFKYAGDYLNVTNNALGILNLKRVGVVGAKVEESEFKSDVNGSNIRLIKSVFNAYKQDFPLLDSIYRIENSTPLTNFIRSDVQNGVVTKDSHYLSVMNFDKYDGSNNLLEQHLTKGPKMSYVWGYNQQYPVAEVSNAGTGEFYFENFETTGVTGISHTGKKRSNGAFTVNWTRPNTRIYTISYWYLENNIWRYKSLPYQADSMTLNSGAAYDDIRIFPVDALMTTYTYDALIGMTSQTDAKGQTTYYEYDNFQRLLNIKDQQGNIVKSYEYHLKP